MQFNFITIPHRVILEFRVLLPIDGHAHVRAEGPHVFLPHGKESTKLDVVISDYTRKFQVDDRQIIVRMHGLMHRA